LLDLLPLLLELLLLLLNLTLSFLLLGLLVLHRIAYQRAANCTYAAADRRPYSRRADCRADYRARRRACPAADQRTFFTSRERLTRASDQGNQSHPSHQRDDRDPSRLCYALAHANHLPDVCSVMVSTFYADDE
jgi:hypothetical protein